MIEDFVRPPKKQPKINTPPNPSIPEAFVTPEQASTNDIFDDTIDLAGVARKKPSGKHRWNKLQAWFLGLNRKQKAGLFFALIVVLTLVGFGVYKFVFYEKPVATPKTAAIIKKIEPKSDTVASVLTGRQVPPAINELPVTGVMIENSVDARPQAGLYDAGVVFEAIAEGGITRFLALYQDTSPADIGPIRSVRPYYLTWASGFDASIAHVGGSPEALAQIKSDGMKDLDQSFNAGYYERRKTKIAPHNVFTSIAKLNELELKKNIGASIYTGFMHKKDAASKAPTAQTISFNISSVKYSTSYTYDVATNSYLRNLAGAAHVDAGNSKQINPKVVIAMVVPYSIHSDGKHSVYGTIGTGSATVFQDGVATTGTWTKSSKNSNITFTDSAGKPLALNAGQAWITAIGAAGKVSYTP